MRNRKARGWCENANFLEHQSIVYHIVMVKIVNSLALWRFMYEICL